MSTKAQIEAAEALAGGVASFLSSLPYMAPELIDFQAKIKLATPLRIYQLAAVEEAFQELQRDPS